MREVYQNIYLKELPLPNNPLKFLNFYIIKGKNKSMIVDTGFNREDTKQEILEALEELGLTFHNTILYLTHLHSDHTGLASFFQTKGMEVYISKIDGDLINQSIHKEDSVWKNVIQHAKLQGLEEDELLLEEHPGYKYRPDCKISYREAVPGERIVIGEYCFEIVDLCGHSPGITGLYERKHNILFCGDHILGKITPNITFWGFEFGDCLGHYFKNLEKVCQMEVKYLFSSHRFLVENHRKRIEEIREHHTKRLEEVRQALKKKKKATVREVAKQMHWDINSRSWEEFPKAQKWFAAGEAHAHLEHLRFLGEILLEEKEGVLYYSIK